MSNDNNTPAAEVNEPEETVNDTTQEEVTEEVTEEATVGDSTGDLEDTSGSDNIPKARLDKEIKRRKELEAKVATLEEKEKVGETTPSDETEKSALEARLETLEGKEKAEKLDATLNSNFAKALEEAPEFKDKVNMDVLKKYALDNSNKTYAQCLEDVYGNTISGTRTAETTTPRGGAEKETLDLDRAGRDNEYLKEVLKDPDLKAQYNKDLEQRIML